MAIAQPPTPWTKRNQETKTQKPSNASLEKSIGSRLTEFRSEEPRANKFEQDRLKKEQANERLLEDIHGNAFDRAAAKNGTKTAPRFHGYAESPELAAAREQAGVGSKTTPKRPPVVFTHSDADWAAILRGWLERTAKTDVLYINTPFNNANLQNMLIHQCSIGAEGFGYNSTSLTACHRWLHQNGYYESAPGQRKRGQAPPKVYPASVERPDGQYSLEPSKPGFHVLISYSNGKIEEFYSPTYAEMTQEVKKRQNFTISKGLKAEVEVKAVGRLAENQLAAAQNGQSVEQESRKQDFDSLAGEVRGGYRKDPRQVVTHV